jgi:hypothetical protein
MLTSALSLALSEEIVFGSIRMNVGDDFGFRGQILQNPVAKSTIHRFPAVFSNLDGKELPIFTREQDANGN